MPSRLSVPPWIEQKLIDDDIEKVQHFRDIVFFSLLKEVNDMTNPKPLCDMMIKQLTVLDSKWAQTTEPFRINSFAAYRAVDKYVRNHLSRKSDIINEAVRRNVIEQSQIFEDQEDSQDFQGEADQLQPQVV
jgi:hypothetical protein